MNHFKHTERATQDRVIDLFKNDLGYTYLGDWENRNNSNVEVTYLIAFLKKQGHSDTIIARTIDKVKNTANQFGKYLYDKNKEFYSLIRYGVPVKEEVGLNAQTIHLIDWQHPKNNDFAIAEEVTVHGTIEKRPDLVLYVNGIALGVIELKKGSHSLSEGIRQSIRNQQPDVIADFFSTIQFVFAGNDTEGLRYGTIETKEKFFLNWKEDIEDQSRLQLDKYLLKLCEKKRFLEIIYDFIIFDGGRKKLPRYHQYFGIKSAQEFVKRKEGGIIWHAQGSGKSIVMVLLARWILEYNPNARVAIITDRDELDVQISKVFRDIGETIHKTTSGKDLISQLTKQKPRLLSSLIHKFGRKDVDDFDQYLEELKSHPIKTQGELFVFVDESHRTQAGRLHQLMKLILKDSVFIGFTGTPLLRKDKKTTLDIFGKYIHTYKFNEAVQDEVVLDLMYEARDIDQRLSSQEKVDEWFDVKTRGLNDYQRRELKHKWGTMQKVLSSKSRMEKIVADIQLDFARYNILSSEKGNAILVAGSIYEACKYYKLFQESEFRGKCAVITSYSPNVGDVRTEDTGEATVTEKEYIYETYEEMLGDMNADNFEETTKKAFINEPARMKILIVVDKLLTGFDAPPCAYLYIDKNMQDHGLFQAICRVNRLDGKHKPFGYIVDYKDLFKKVENAISVYTSEIDYTGMAIGDADIILKDRLIVAREKLEEALEAIEHLCEPVLPPKDELEYQRYFCGNTEIPDDIQENEFKRSNLYKLTANLIRTFANISGEMEEAKYTPSEIQHRQSRVTFYVELKNRIKLASGDVIDLKAYEADMRFMIDHYIQADESRKISLFDDLSLLDIIEKLGIKKAIDELPPEINQHETNVAETIENNVRQKIIKDELLDPAFYNRMSDLLQEIILARKSQAVSYENYLKRIAVLAMQVNIGNASEAPPELNTQAQRALYNNLGKDTQLAKRLHETILKEKPDDWRGNQAKESVLKKALYDTLNQNVEEVERVFKIIYEQREY